MKIRLISILFTLPMLIGLAQAQSGMNVDNSPSLTVIGLYSLSADKEAYSRFIREQIASHDPANFSEETKALFRRLGRGDALQPFTDEDRENWEDHFRHHMDDAAVLEVLVSNPDTHFDVGGFIQPDPSQAEGFWQVAWNEKFLTSDGEKLIELDRKSKLPDAKQYRVVFVIHFWKPNLPLRSSYGELALPSIQSLPERLWRLAPYELPS
jgi:hypothetical protein